MNIKKGDTVQIMKGKEAAAARTTGKPPRGVVSEVLLDTQRVRVEGMRLVKKHLKRGRDQQNPEGGRLDIVGTIALANVQLVCPNCGKPTRVGHKKVDAGGDKGMKNARYCAKCEQLIDKK